MSVIKDDKKREKRLLKIIEFFEKRPYSIRLQIKIFYPFRSHIKMMRVFSLKNMHTEEDLDAWEKMIKRIKRYEKKKSKYKA